jgi:hypothetical protein
VTVFDSAAKEVEQDAPMVVGLEETPPEKAAPPPKSAGGAPHGGNPHGGLGGLPSGHPVVPPAGNPHAAPPAGDPHAPAKP